MDEVLFNWAKSDGTILLLGETGVGKSFVAKKIHENSTRRSGPFVVAHLASISDDLIESELFGHVKGAFTSADQDKIGYVEAAGSGTLFLDEIGELSLKAQKKLLYLLEEKKYTRVGSSRANKFNGRIVAATNKDLKSMVQKGEFREDLYYRLMVFIKEISPLRKRRPELKKMIGQTLHRSIDKYSTEHVDLESGLYDYLAEEYCWPGNIRELGNVMDYLVNVGKSVVGINDLPCWLDRGAGKDNCTLTTNSESENNSMTDYPQDYHLALDLFEKRYIGHQLQKFDGRVNHTAEVLRVSKSTLIAKIRKYGINIWQIKADRHDTWVLR